MPSVADNEYAALAATYGPGLSLQDMRYKKYGGPGSPVKSETDLEYLYWGAGTTQSLSDKMMANLKAATGGSGSLSDLGGSYWASGGARVNFATNSGYESGTDCFFSNNGSLYPITGDIVAPIAGARSAMTTRTTTSLNLTVTSMLLTSSTLAARFPVTVGIPVTCGVSLKTDTANTKFQARWVWYDSGGSPTNEAYSDKVANATPGQVYRVVTISTPPVGTVTATLTVQIVLNSGNCVGGEKVWADQLTLENGTTDGSWFVNYGSPAVTIDQLFATNPFYVGHRGSGDVYPEHTQVSYQGAVDSGVKALEMSIQRNSQGTWFHLHDAGSTGLNRTTDRTGDPSLLTDAQLATTHVVSPQLGFFWGNSANYPLVPKWFDMMDLYYNKVVLFLECKDYNNAVTDNMLSLLASRYPGYQNSVIFKSHVGGTYGMGKARAQGMKVWCYIDDPLNTAQLDTAVQYGDYIGVNVAPFATDSGQMSDADISTVIARGKPVIQWSSPTRSARNRTNALGVKGYVSSMVPYTQNDLASRTSDNFVTGKASAGDIGLDSTHTGIITSPRDLLLSGTASNPAVMMGSMCPVGSLYTIDYDMCYDKFQADLTLHSGVVFGKVDDSRYQFQSSSNPTGGYHLVMRGNGQMSLSTHAPFTSAGTVIINPYQTDAPVAGAWMHFQVELTATAVTIQRTDGTLTAKQSNSNTAFRGGYFWMSRNHTIPDSSYGVRFRNIVVVKKG